MQGPIESRKDKQILEYPENWDDMVKKYQEREKEQKVEASKEDAIRVIHEKQSRYAKDRETLTAKVVIRDAQDPEIKGLQKHLEEEVKKTEEILRQRLPEFTRTATRGLKGRVTDERKEHL